MQYCIDIGRIGIRAAIFLCDETTSAITTVCLMERSPIFFHAINTIILSTTNNIGKIRRGVTTDKEHIGKSIILALRPCTAIILA